MTNEQVTKTVVGFGEVVWDLFPDGKRLGGAPANFAYHATQLGLRGVPVSAVGTDALGEEAIAHLDGHSVDTAYIARDEVHPTGTVDIVLANGEPRYTIAENVAWEHITWHENLTELAASADAVCYGTLAQRGNETRDALTHFRTSTEEGCVRVFDVNLRQHFFTADILETSLVHATIVKLNVAELPIVCDLLDIDGTHLREQMHAMRSRFDVDVMCVTRGAQGSVLISATEVIEHSGIAVDVADPVGAGDAFVAAMVKAYLVGEDLATISRNANEHAAWVASQPGAMPVYTQ